ncbi:carboxypeptidase-like regulatory domain-containing protein, partial [Pedobacter antarcticus]
MKSLIFLICLFAGISGAAAQSYRLEGRLSDELLNPVASAGIFLFKVKDSVQVKAVMSDEKGGFELSDIPAGKYYVRISYIGFTNYFSAALELNEQRKFHNFGHIKLVPDQQVLETVNIKGSKAQIEQSLDRVVLNVENSILAEGGTALDVLSKAPGLTVSDDGSVSLKGRPGTMVMINGKPTYLSGSQLANLLRGTSSGQISKIEIMANPPAGYDAAGKGGIVNIVMKKSLKAGLNGSL